MLVKNFLFHRVSEQPDKLWPPMKPHLFEEIIKFLCKNYHVQNLEEVVAGNVSSLSSKKIATVLFDDGYKDNIEYALPILQKYKCTASFYVATGCIDNNIPTWTYIVDHLFQNTQKQVLQLDMDFVPLSFRISDCKFPEHRLELGGKLKPWMKSLSNSERQQVLDHLETSFNDVEVPRDKMMNWGDLREIQRCGYTIGSHSVSHPLLGSIKEEQELFFELQESGKRIEKELGKFPVTISYPVGSFDERVIAGAKKAGYKMGLAVEQKFYNTGKDDVFAIPRVELYNESMWKSRMRISGLYSWLKSKMS